MSTLAGQRGQQSLGSVRSMCLSNGLGNYEHSRPSPPSLLHTAVLTHHKAPLSHLFLKHHSLFLVSQLSIGSSTYPSKAPEIILGVRADAITTIPPSLG